MVRTATGGRLGISTNPYNGFLDMAQFRHRACHYDSIKAIFEDFAENQIKLGTDQTGTMLR